MAEASQQRVVPGAPLAQSKSAASNKKKKGVQQSHPTQASTKEKRIEPQEALKKAVKEAALIEKAPKFGKVDESVKVQAKDLAEQAEKTSAIAAVAIVEEKEGNGSIADKDSKSPLQTALAKRIKVLSKKLQKANAYEALEEEKLNADMKRIIASKSSLEGAVAELTEIAKAVEISEAEAAKESKQQSKLATEVIRREMLSDQEKKHSIFYQFLYLRSLFQPSAIPTFAPTPLPSVVNKVTAQDVGAIERLFADFSSSMELVTQSSKDMMIEKLASRSGEEIIQGVAYLRISELIDDLSSPVMEQPQEQPQVLESKKVSAPQSTPPSGQILFMQESEIVSGQDSDATEQAEPEGGAVEGLPVSKDLLATNGTIMGDISAHAGAKQDGSAQAQVEEPIGTREVGKKEEDLLKVEETTNEPSDSTSNAVAKKIDWAADDDDWSDMVMQPSGVASSLHQATTPLATLTAQAHEDTSNTNEEKSASPKVNGIGKHNTPSASNSAQAQKTQVKGNIDQPKISTSQNNIQNATKPSGPVVDEDGFIVASSKRSKQQQQQQQYHNQSQNQPNNQHQAFRNGGRGGREGGKANNTRGGARGGFASGRQNGPGMGSGRGGSKFTDNRGRGRGSKPDISET